MVNATRTSQDRFKGHKTDVDTCIVDRQNANPDSVKNLKRYDFIFSFSILFISAWNMCLPVAVHIDLPWWFTRIQILPFVYLNEALFLVYLIIGGFRYVRDHFFELQYPNRSAAIYIIALSFLCATSSITGPLPLYDAGKAARLILIAFLLIAATHWASYAPLFVLRSFLIGLVAGTIANLFFTFENPYIKVWTLARLLGQNGPGPPMAIAVCLSAWLALFSQKRIDMIISILVSVICGIGFMISYSKIALSVGLLGFFCIVLVALKKLRREGIQLLFYLAIIVTLCFSIYFNTEGGQEDYYSLKLMINQKIESADPSSSVSIQQRMNYIWGVGEILLSHPIGVGFSGFRDALLRTDAYHSGLAADDASLEPAESNPHAFFLYYVSAGGIIGGLLSVAVFSLLWRMLHRGLRTYGLVGVVVANLTGFAYLIMAISIPYLLNSVIMIIPAAVAAGCLIIKRDAIHT